MNVVGCARSTDDRAPLVTAHGRLEGGVTRCIMSIAVTMMIQHSCCARGRLAVVPMSGPKF